MPEENIHPVADKLLDRPTKELSLGARAGVFWLCGLSGSGKSTLASALELSLSQRDIHSIVLDGDNLRSGINQGLGFTDEDRMENIRRTAEIAKLLVRNGLVVIVSLITPLKRYRQRDAEIIGSSANHEVFVKASFDHCQKRDVKGLYAKAAKNEIDFFTGKSSDFEEPSEPWLALDTENQSLRQSAETLEAKVLEVISRS